MQAVMRVEALLVAYEKRQLQLAAGAGVGVGAGAGGAMTSTTTTTTATTTATTATATTMMNVVGESNESEASLESDAEESEEDKEDKDMARFWATTSMGRTKDSVTKESVTKDSVTKDSVTNERAAKDGGTKDSGNEMTKQSVVNTSVAKASVANEEKEGGDMDMDNTTRTVEKGDQGVGATVLPVVPEKEVSGKVVREREEGEEGVYIRYFQAQALQSSSYMYNDWEVVNGRIKQYMSLLSWYYDQHYSTYSEAKKKERALSGYMSGTS